MNENIATLLSIVLPIISFSAVIIFWYLRFQKTSEEEQQLWNRRLQTVKKGKVIGGEAVSSLLQNDKSNIEKNIERLFQSKLTRVNDLKHWLQRTGYNISPVSFVASIFGLFIVISFSLMAAYSMEFYYAFVIALAISILLSVFVVSYMVNKRKDHFIKIFPNALDMIRRALRAGYTPQRALEMVANEIEDPVGATFKFIVERLSLGGSLEDTLAETSSRLDIDDFHFLAIVMILQKETGGSLAEAVESLSSLLRERGRLKMKIRALAAEGKAGGYVLTALPFAFLFLINFMNPGYIRPLFVTVTGNHLLIIGGILISCGVLTIFRMVKIDI